MADPLSCCPGMAYYASNAPVQGESRFDDPECLIHQAEDGNVGIILHDGSGRYSIIRFCPWCGTPVGPEAEDRSAREALMEFDVLTQGNAVDHSLLDAPSSAAQRLSPTPALFPRGTAPRSHKKKPASPKGGNRKTWDAAARQEASDRAKAAHQARRLAASTIAPGQDEEP